MNQSSCFSLKCNQKNHLNDEKLAVCIKEGCKENRLACWKCITQFHATHLNHLIGVSDLKNNSVDICSTDEDLQKIWKALADSSYDQLISKIESLFKDFVTKFLEEIEIVKKKVFAKMEPSQGNDLIFQIKKELNSVGDLKGLIELINKIQIDKFYEDEKEFNQKVSDFILETNEPRMKSIESLKKCYNEWETKHQMILDETDFSETSKRCIQNLSSFENIIRKKKPPSITKFEFSGSYMSGNNLAGTNNLNDLNDTSLMKGICAVSPGWIVFEFSYIAKISSLKIAGWHGNPNIWGPGNGTGGNIYVSTDKNSWDLIGNIPNIAEKSIKTVHLNEAKAAKYLKFQNNGYLGIGYFEIEC